MKKYFTIKNCLVFFYIILVVALVALDQSTKFHAEKNFLTISHPSEVRTFQNSHYRVQTWGVSPSLAFENGVGLQVSSNWCDFFLTYTRNVGAAWSMFANMPDTFRQPFFITVTLIALLAIMWMFYASHAGMRLHRLGLAFILGGALGNFIDRINLKYVIDWIQFHWKIFGWEYSFPVFNCADISINIGIGLIIIDLVIQEFYIKKSSKKEVILPS